MYILWVMEPHLVSYLHPVGYGNKKISVREFIWRRIKKGKKRQNTEGKRRGGGLKVV
jgi:hypothetical protein